MSDSTANATTVDGRKELLTEYDNVEPVQLDLVVFETGDRDLQLDNGVSGNNDNNAGSNAGSGKNVKVDPEGQIQHSTSVVETAHVNIKSNTGRPKDKKTSKDGGKDQPDAELEGK